MIEVYYFLGIVAMDDIRRGNITPSYILCKSKGTSVRRSGLRVVKANSTFANMEKVLVVDFNRHQELVDFLSNYRTRNHMHGSKRYRHHNTMKYTPEGGLFWFPCTKSGIRARRKPPIFVKLVPDRSGRVTDDGFARLRRSAEVRATTLELWTREPYAELYPVSKPICQQHVLKEKVKHGKESLQRTQRNQRKRPRRTEEQAELPELGLGLADSQAELP